jgi:microcystin-dependent protein
MINSPYPPYYTLCNVCQLDNRQTFDSGPKKSFNTYSTPPMTAPVTLDPATVQPSGGSGPHANIQPVLALNYIIALQGIFPSRS